MSNVICSHVPLMVYSVHFQSLIIQTVTNSSRQLKCHGQRIEAVCHVIPQISLSMVHQKNFKATYDRARWTGGQDAGGHAGPTPPAGSRQRRVPALPPPPSMAWPWWAHMDPSYPDALLTFLEMRLRRKYHQERVPQRSLVTDGTQTDDVARPPVDDQWSRPLETQVHRTSGYPQSERKGQCSGPLTTDVSDQLNNAHHSSSPSREDETIASRTATYSHSSQNTHSTPNHQVLIQKSGASSTVGNHQQERHRAPFVTPRMEAVQYLSVTPSSQLSTKRTFSMRGGEWYVEHQSSASEVNPDTEANRNYPSTDRNTDRMLINRILNPKSQSIFHKLFRFQTKSTVNSDTSIKCSVPSDGQSTVKNDFKSGSPTCKTPTKNTYKKDFLKFEKDFAVCSVKDTDKYAFTHNFDREKRHARDVDHSHRRRPKSADELQCIYYNKSPSYSSIVDDLFYASDSSSSEVNLFFTTMNFGTVFSTADSSSESASSSYSPRRSKDRQECIDLRSALTSVSGNLLTEEESEDVPSKHSVHLPVSRTRSLHSTAGPVSFHNEQHTRCSGPTVKSATEETSANYCGIQDTTRERIEIEFLKSAVIKLFDMNPEQLKGDDRNFRLQMESITTPTSSTSRKSPGRSPRTSKNTGTRVSRLKAKESNEGVFVRMWQNIMRVFQRKTEPVQDSEPRVSTERIVRSPGKSGTKASETNDHDRNLDGTFMLRVPALSRIDEVPEPTTSGSSAFGTGPSSSEHSSSTRRKM